MPESNESVEARDIDVANVLKAAAALVIVIALTIVICWLLLDRWRGAESPAPAAPPQPGAASAPQQERDAYFEAKRRQLDSWQWLDREAGTARIPIDVAIDVLAARAQERRP